MMTMDRPAAKTKPVLRTTDATTGRVRALIGAMSAELGGRRITQEEIVAALATLGERNKEALAAILQE